MSRIQWDAMSAKVLEYELNVRREHEFRIQSDEMSAEVIEY